EREIEVVRDLLRADEVALVTLAGPGGVGKTRLALAAAATVAADFADGVAFVALAAIRDPALVLPTIANALGLVDMGSRSLGERLVRPLRARQVLLVLDNVEQVVEAAPEIGGLLAFCPRLKILATSRVVLRLSAEQVVSVAPLAVPSEGASPRLGTPPVPPRRPFVTRARAGRPPLPAAPPPPPPPA